MGSSHGKYIPVGPVRQENVLNLAEEEEKSASLLVEIGTKRKAARVLASLALYGSCFRGNWAGERPVPVRSEPAVKYPQDSGWIKSRKGSPDGRPTVSETAESISLIMDCIGKEKKEEPGTAERLVKRLRNYQE